ncbi:DUF3619 family protein [Uliginosibacterium sp. 31-16]|uniref:DUF3619 family protein n=1 Tax=Uliginosibacterium sp. 31-16 TaxID=3068315 RepID=UPI00273D2382|nr:DUF3619 family protein [Uliginosibacterium sp. 31-16]MDP5241203.1 DUF3619 family protein [Uliginosibacterium sp. 31-16]
MNTPHTEEREFGQYIRHKLNLGLTQLNEPVVSRLHAARQAALARQPAAAASLSLAGAGRHTWAWCEDNVRPFLMALSLAAAIVCGNYLMSAQRMDELEDIDSALLTDDLPIEAYLDNGFHSWLADTSSQH